VQGRYDRRAQGKLCRTNNLKIGGKQGTRGRGRAGAEVGTSSVDGAGSMNKERCRTGKCLETIDKKKQKSGKKTTERVIGRRVFAGGPW